MSTAVATHEITLLAVYAILYESLLKRNTSLLLGHYLPDVHCLLNPEEG